MNSDSSKSIRIGGASAFLGDSSIAMPQLLEGGGCSYIILDYLAEVTMSLLARSKSKRSSMGYAPNFVTDIVANNIERIVEERVKIVTNAGGMNPSACRDAVLKLVDEKGLNLNVAIVEGDDLTARQCELATAGHVEMFTGEPFPKEVKSVNAYLGAGSIVQALEMGADIVITGRVVDSALTLGPLIHEFQWKEDEYGLLAAGSLAGHIIECGAQATGGLYTDWEEVPDWANIGYPIVECYADGRFIVMKPDGTGGIVNTATVAEQLLYEIGDPQAYILPDVVCDFSQVCIEQAGKDRVEVSGAVGYPATGTYKAMGIFKDGYRCITVSPVIGVDAVRKAERQAEAMIQRTRKLFEQKGLGDYRDTLVECIGAECSYGPHSRALGTREVACKIGLEHDDRKALEMFAKEAYAPTTSMAPGTTGWFAGKPSIEPVLRLFSFLLPKSEVTSKISLNGSSRYYSPKVVNERYSKLVTRPTVVEVKKSDHMEAVPLIQLAWARSGDKGNTFNIGVIARKAYYLPYIRASLSEEAVFQFMRHVFRGARNPRVERFDLPGIDALNFLFGESLGGGQMATLRMDALAKGMAQQLLEIPVEIPENLAPGLNQVPDPNQLLL